jgi:hypothetical protein
MARLIPHADPSQITLEPERKVAEALCSQLQKNVVVFHSYPWLRPERDLDRPASRPVLREGEADFVVLHPRYGILVIEVKGGHLRFDTETQQWDRHGSTHRVKDPFGQASKNLRAIETQLKQRSFGGYAELPFSRARCVVFPHCEYQGTLPPGADRSLLFGASDLAKLGEKIETLFRLQPFVPPAELSRGILDGISRGLTSTFQLVPALWSEIEEQEKKLFCFTETQLQLLTFLQSHDRATIQGVAGSGKTVLAVAKARAFADEGKRVLFVCFNEMLADWLRSRLPDAYRESVTIRNYHKLCSEWVRGAGLPWPQVVDEQAFFAKSAPALLEQAVDLLPERSFDAVVVDEGQDFMPAWWDTIELINKRPTEGPLYIFFDPEQQIFHQTAPSMPDLGKPFVLPVNCRNTGSIAGRCGEIIGRKIPVNQGTPEGRPPTLVHAPNSAAQVKAVEKQLKEWMTPPAGLKPGQVAIVTRGSVQASPLAALGHLGGFPLTRKLEEWQSGAGILLTSLYRFKGLEADALILTDIIKPDPLATLPGFRPEHFYVACSRAKHLLAIIASQEDLGR